jgi:MFS family permease
MSARPADIAVPHGASEADQAYRKIYLRLIPFLMFCYLLAFLGRTNVGFGKLEFLHDLGFTEAIYGFGAGIFFIGYVLFEVPSNLILEKIGVRKTLLRIMVLWGICATANAFITAAWHFYTLRFLLGAAEAGFFPGILFYLTLWTPARRRAGLTAMFMSSIGITGVIGGPLSGWIMSSLAGTYGLAGWQWMFLVEGIPSIIFGFVAFVYLNDTPRQAKWLTDSEKAIVIADLDAEIAAQSGKTHHSFGAALRAPQFYVLVCFATALLASTGGIFFWLPTIIRNSGVRDVLDVGLLSAIPFVIGVPAQQLIAFRSDRSLERRWHASGAALVSALGWGMLPFVARNPALSLAALTLTTVGTLGAMGPFWTMPSALLTGPARAGGIALITTLGGIGSFFSPWLVGWLSTHTGSLASGQYYYAGLMFFGAVVLLAGIPAAQGRTAKAA